MQNNNQNVNGVWETAVDSIKKVFGGGKTTTELQAVSTGVAEGTIASIDKVEKITSYAVIGGIIIVGLILYKEFVK